MPEMRNATVVIIFAITTASVTIKVVDATCKKMTRVVLRFKAKMVFS